jgi:hypothetical protein
MKEFIIALIVVAALYVLAGIFFMAYTAIQTDENIDPRLILTWITKIC